LEIVVPQSPAPSPATIVASHISKSRGAAPVLSEVDLTLGPDQRLGVIGPNGVGKTTLLRVLAGLESPDDGRVSLSPAAATVGYLAQEPEVSDESVADFLARRAGVGVATAELEAAAGALAVAEPGSDDRYAAALERYLALGGPDFEARSASVLDDLGLEGRLLGLPTVALSGGQRARTSLAGLLLGRYDLLLLDEPTNDLDFDGLERLERFLLERQGGLAVVSHDRAFLERVVSSIVDIDESSHRAALYAGGYSAYLEAKATARRHAEQDYETYVTERERLRQRERTQRQWAVSGVSKERRNPKDHDKAQRDFRINRSEKQASKIRITEKALERLQAVQKPFEGWELHLDLTATRRSGDVVARLAGAVVERGDWRLGPVDLEVAWADRLAIVGPNGSGKTTLLSALLGRLALTSGERSLGPSVVSGELGQDRRRFSEGTGTLLETFLEAMGRDGSLTEARSVLAKFGLGASHVVRPAATLSPGERTRAELALLVARGTNCLVLDEPTNHLDLAAIEEFERALEAWEGTLLLVTHDRRLLESVRTTTRVALEHGRVSVLLQ
jgi:ATPase subunit of ABC transporter with duplicated ATPase domains